MKPIGIAKVQRSPYYLLDRLGILERIIKNKQEKGNLTVFIPCYHRFSPFKELIPSIPPRLSIKAFQQQIEYICRHFEPVPLSLIASCIQERKPFPKNSITITIDDGYKDNYLYAYPILKKYKVPATIFLVTSYMDGKETPWEAKIYHAIFQTSLKEINLEGVGRFSLEGEKKRYIAVKLIIKRLKRFTDSRKNLLTDELLKLCKVDIPPNLGRDLMLYWEEIREMSEGGIEFGAHTVTHPILTNIPLEEAKKEIELSKREIEDRIGKPVVSFAYPSGVYNREVVNLVKKAGFLCAVTTNLEEVKPWSNPFEIGRVIGMDEDFPKFKAVLAGVYYKINSCWGLIR